MKRRNRSYEEAPTRRTRLVVRVRIVSNELVASSSLAGVPDHLERRHAMRRISLNRGALVALAIMVVAALVALAFPLAASASCGNGTCGW